MRLFLCQTPTENKHASRARRHDRKWFTARFVGTTGVNGALTVEWYRAGLDVTRELPKLATYLGHVDVGLTYWYIEAVPELLQLAAKYPGKDRPGEQP